MVHQEASGEKKTWKFLERWLAGSMEKYKPLKNITFITQWFLRCKNTVGFLDDPALEVLRGMLLVEIVVCA